MIDLCSRFTEEAFDLIDAIHADETQHTYASAVKIDIQVSKTIRVLERLVRKNYERKKVFGIDDASELRMCPEGGCEECAVEQ